MAKTNTHPVVNYKQRALTYIAAARRSKLFSFFLLWGAAYAVLLSSFFRSILHNFSYLEVFPRELIFPSIMHAGSALLIALVLYWLPWLRNFLAKLIAGIFIALLLVDYDQKLQTMAGPIKAFTPGLTGSDPWFIISLIYLAMLVGFSVALARGVEYLLAKWKQVKATDAIAGILVLIGFLFISPAFSVFKHMSTVIPESKVSASEFQKQNPVNSSDKPDIYYIVLDRYTNNAVLKDQFGFDNGQFLQYLEDSGFRVNNNAYSNYPYTAMSVASTLNADYTGKFVAPFKDKDTQSRTLYHNLIQQSNVIKALKEEGYQYYSLGSWYGATYKTPLAEREYISPSLLTIFKKNKRLRGIEAGEFTKSPYYRFAQITTPWWPLKFEQKDHAAIIRDQLNTLNDLTVKEKPGGRFIFAHILSPHDPFIFNSDGSLSAHPNPDNAGKPIKQKYTDQISHINSHLQQIIANIHKQTQGQAVIIINSDEGGYPNRYDSTFTHPVHVESATLAAMENEDMREWSDDWLRMKFGILQAAYIPKATEDDLAHFSSINAFRIVLNRYASHSLEYLPQCHFGLTNGRKDEFNYADITSRLIDTPSPQCEKLESVRTSK